MILTLLASFLISLLTIWFALGATGWVIMVFDRDTMISDQTTLRDWIMLPVCALFGPFTFALAITDSR